MDSDADGRSHRSFLSRTAPLKWRGRSGDEDRVEDVDSTERELADQLGNNLVLGRGGANSPLLAHRREGSVYSSNRSETSAEDESADGFSEVGGNSNNRWSHDYQASISSEEGNNGISVRSRRTRLKNPPGGRANVNRSSMEDGAVPWPAEEMPTPMSADSGAFSTWSAPGDLDRYSPSNRTRSGDVFSEFTSSSGANYGRVLRDRQMPNLAESDPELSRRMDGIRDQKLRSQFQGADAMRRSARANPEPNWASATAQDAMRRSVRVNPEANWASASAAERSPITPHCCLHCRNNTCSAFSVLPLENCCADGKCRICSHCCCYPSAAQGRRCHAIPGPRPVAGDPGDDSQRKKQAVCPVFGGAGYILCYICSQLIQIPQNFHFLGGRCNQMKCGSCSTMLSFSLVDRTRIVQSESRELPIQVPGFAADSPMRPPYGNPSAGPSQEDDWSTYNVANDTTDYATDASGGGGNRVSGGRNSSKKKTALHRMMGYFSARDIM